MKKYSLSVVVAVASAAIMAACAAPVHAKGFTPSRSYSAPKPAPRVVNRTTNNTTIIRETRVVRPVQQSSGGGFMSSLLGGVVGGAGGAMIGNALSKPAEAPVQAPVPQQIPACDATIYNCTPKAK